MFDGFNTAKKKNKQLNKHGIYIYIYDPMFDVEHTGNV